MTTGDPGREPGGVALADALVQLSFVLQGVLARLADDHGLTTTGVRLLAVLEDREIGMQRLARILEIEKSSVSGLVDRAQRRGLVDRVPVPGNRRATDVVLTPAARSLITEVRRRVEEELGELSAGLAGPERDGLAAAVRTLLDAYARRHAIPW